MDFDKRTVRFETVHNIKQEEFDQYLKLGVLQDFNKIVDLGCGYGAVTREILKKTARSNFSFILIDNSINQINNAKKELSIYKSESTKVDYICEDARLTNLSSQVDRVFAKMFFHELKDEDQSIILGKILKWLKPNGKLLIWDISPDIRDQDRFNQIIHFKDELARFIDLKEKRYFFNQKEMIGKLHKHNYDAINSYSFDLMIDTKNLLIDFNNDIDKLLRWNNYIKEVFFDSDIIISRTDLNIRLKLKQTLYVATR